MERIYQVTSNKEEFWTDEQLNYIYFYDEVFKTKAAALKDVKQSTKEFNRKFGTNFKCQDIFCIELKIYDEDGDLVEAESIDFDCSEARTMKQKYIDIQNEVIKKHRIDICNGTKCEDGDWYRTHAHVKKRRVCKWKQANSISSTFTLFHEIGHIESNNSSMRRCEEEYYATAWAIEKFKEYGLEVPSKTIQEYQIYINMEHARGIRRKGNLPSLELLQLSV